MLVDDQQTTQRDMAMTPVKELGFTFSTLMCLSMLGALLTPIILAAEYGG